MSHELLTIDDSLTCREELKDLLEDEGYSVRSAATGEEGIRVAIQHRPALIIIDGQLPDIDGTTVIRLLRMNSALRTTPCLLLTSHTELTNEIWALDSGADGYITKDAEQNLLLARIAALLHNSTFTPVTIPPMPCDQPSRILAVDDSPTFLHILEEKLREAGYDVVLANSGSAALDLLQNTPVDAIVLDQVMPGISGQEACRLIKQAPTWHNLPILILSSQDSPESMVEGFNAGADDYTVKSDDFAVLISRLRALLRRKLFEDENRRGREQLLRQSEDRYRALTEAAEDLIFIVCEGFLEYVNPAAARMLGKPTEQLVGKPFAALTPPDVTQQREAAIAQMLETKKPANYTVRYPFKTGERWFDASWVPLARPAGATAALGILRDVTKRIQAEKKYELIIQTALDGFGMVDAEGRFRDVNEAYLNMIGYSRDEFLKMKIADVEKNEVPQEVAMHIQKIQSTGGDRFETRHTRKDGKILNVELSVQTLPEADGAMFVFIRDITERKQAREALLALNRDLDQRVMLRTRDLGVAMKELEAFSFSVSHDLRAPLRHISGFVNMLAEEYGDKLSTEGQSYFSRISGSIAEMGRLIDDLLALSRITRHDLQLIPFDLADKFRRSAEVLKQSAPDRKVEFIIPQTLPVVGDPGLIGIALDNLLGNSFKYTSKHPTARIEVGTLQKDQETVYYVKDDGAGFDMNYAQVLFNAFRRLHNVSEFEGSGIGLATVARIIRRHGGRIWADGAIEKGATFFFTLKGHNEATSPAFGEIMVSEELRLTTPPCGD